MNAVSVRVRWIALGAVLIAGAVAAALPALAGGNLEVIQNNGTQPSSANRVWGSAWVPAAIPIPWRINQQGVINNCNNGNPTCVGGVSPLTLDRAVAAMTAAFDTWQAIPTSKIAFTYAGTSTKTAIGLDDIHLITWADTTTPGLCPTGAIAVTPSVRLAVSYTPTNSASSRDLNGDGIVDLDPAIYPSGTAILPGTIIDADMAWCPQSADFSDAPIDFRNPPSGQIVLDMGGVGTHEIGHFHGLSHSTVIQPLATMFPFVDVTAAWGRDVRVLSQDDIASSSRIYPENSFFSSLGAISGRLFFPGGTTPATGVSVTAINRATGEQTVEVFSVNEFTSTSQLPGAFFINGLPPGTYYVAAQYFDWTTGAEGVWWDGARYNVTTRFSNVTGVSRPTVTRPEFYSVPENSTDDLEDAAPVTLGLGEVASIGSIVINSDAPPAPAGATQLNLANGSSVEVPLGFTFPFYDRLWTSVFVNDNGNLTFGAPAYYTDTRNFLGPDQLTGAPVPPRIGIPMTNLDPAVDNQGQSGGALDVFRRLVSDTQGTRMEIIYLGTPVISSHKSCTAIVRLFSTGRIEIQLKYFSAWWGILGISPGGDGTEPRAEIDITRDVPFRQTVDNQAIFEHFEFQQPETIGGAPGSGSYPPFLDAVDLNGALFVFQKDPATSGVAYILSSPFFGRPGEVQNVRFTGATDVAWDPYAGAGAYNVYRGSLSSLIDTNGDGASESYGTCLEPGWPNTTITDVSTPATGSAFFYLVTVRGASQGLEGILGYASSGAPRPNLSPCP
jgi:hypothetical protein